MRRHGQDTLSQPTPTDRNQPQRLADFRTLTEALDYAAEGDAGFNFYDGRGNLNHVLPYSELRERAIATAQRLLAHGLERGDRVAILADTSPTFPITFFACQYAGLTPVALPVALNLAGRSAYIEQLKRLIDACDAAMAVTSPSLYDIAYAATTSAGSIPLATLDSLENETTAKTNLTPSQEDEPAYIQFTSGSTRFPKGVVLTQRAVMKNLQGIGYGLQVGPTDRCVSWLPFYHDMGLVGFVLGPLTSQLSVDYLPSYEYAKRPLEWLRLIHRNRGTIAFSPLLGYELCSRRLASYDASQLDLSCWRVAGAGAEMIHRKPLERFAERLEPAGFSPKAFLPCYGLAEVTLAVTFGDLSSEVQTDTVAPPDEPNRVKEFVNCGKPLPDLELAIRDEQGHDLSPGTIGRILVRGPSVMTGYYNDPDATDKALSADGWLDTGDLGLMTENGLVITGRSKELIIINGRNIWPQDLEAIAEDEPQVRFGDALAFAADAPDGDVVVVLMVQNRLTEEADRDALIKRLQSHVYQAVGVNCRVILVPPHTLPRTSSGKMSRTKARRIFLERMGWLPATTGTKTTAPESRVASGG